MTWAEYYERYDRWQESTQYSRLASIEDFGPDGSPSEEISDCIQYVDTLLSCLDDPEPVYGHMDGCEFCGNGGCSGKCNLD